MCIFVFIILNFYIFLDFLNLEIIEFMLQVKKFINLSIKFLNKFNTFIDR